MQLEMTINGEPRVADVDERMLLVDALRDAFAATGPKIGCLTGDCGACTVSLNGEITKSCLRLAVACDHATVRTLEGLSGENGELSPLQRAFWDHNGFQCGYCLSGMLFAAEDLLARNPDPSDAEIRAAISGNLCRCTGYDAIVAAIRAAATDATATTTASATATGAHA